MAAYKLRVPQSKPAPINAATRLCAVLGSPIRHSASPAMHNAAFAALGLNWRYLAFEVKPKNLRAAIEGAAPGTVIVLTGRDACQELIDLADTVSRIECVKHGMHNGWPVQKGVEL